MRNLFASWCLLSCLFLCTQVAHADLNLEYQVQFVDSMGNDLAGPVSQGSTVFWRMSALITGSPNVGTNFGIATLSAGLEDSFAETLSAGTVGPAFAGYTTTSGGIPIGNQLQFISVQQDTQNGSTVGLGNDPGSFLLASGSYTVNTLGLHTLSAVAPLGLDTSTYFTAAGQSDALASVYDNISFSSDSLQVNLSVVPEPTSLAMLGLACLGGGIVQVRRRRKDGVNTQSV